ncbi:SHOCT domain-containing protein [Pseudoclavibacter sp. Z016]|nr:SHOCT domain-containing protein [Pseudoclavibacter sp. Z016]
MNRRPPALPAPSALAAHLRQLASLRDDGILSEEEFSTKKAEVLARL